MKRFLCIVLALTAWTVRSYAGWTTSSLNFDGHVRSYMTYTPANYNPAVPASLIVVLHGLGGSMTDVAGVGISQIADTANIILLSPQALDFNSPLGLIESAWNSGIAVTVPGLGTIPVNPDIDDVGFVNAMMDIAQSTYSIRAGRVYVCGASMGGFLTQRLACESASRFAAVASVMGTYALALPPCNPGKMLPVAHFHGTADNVVSYNGELQYSGMTFPVGLSVDSLIRKWVVNDACAAEPVHENRPDVNGDGISSDHYLYSDAQGRSRVELFRVNGGMHAWYQNSNTGGELDYSLEIWKFFNKQYQYETTGIAGVNPSSVNIKVYPNPAGQRLFVSSDKTVNVSLSDISGKMIRYQDAVGKEGMDIATLAPGTYLVRLQSADGSTTVKKICKL
ncbi:MAG: T9SS type A sorting domain-containing protein [Sphingobacteriales bacterium]|nr:MAG: T9SS type A sorting domain-containing protein [Sphingobacteriales bacterium]